MTRFVVIDTETTGLDPFKGNHRVIELSAVEVIDGKITANKFSTYLNPQGKKSTTGALKVHQIPDEHLIDKSLFLDIAKDFLEFINGATLVFFNRQFDINFLNHELRTNGHETVDLLKDYKTRCLMLEALETTKQKKISLDRACKIYEVDTSSREVHGAYVDSILTARLMIAMDSRKPLPVAPQTAVRREQEQFPFPRSTNGIQLNFCRNVICKNYGVPAQQPKIGKNGKYKWRLGGNYTIKMDVRDRNDQVKYSLICGECKKRTSVIDNNSFVKESNRVKNCFTPPSPACPNTGLNPDKKRGVPDGRRYKNITKKVNGREREFKRLLPSCGNAKLPFYDYPDNYWLRGSNRKEAPLRANKPILSHPRKISGTKVHVGNVENESKVIQCKSCGTLFTIKVDPQKGQRITQNNYQIFSSLVNKGIINRIIETVRVHPQTIYDRIEFFYKQCIAFDQYQLKQNIHKLKGKTLNISVDKQHFYTNWSYTGYSGDKTFLVNLSSVDNESRYVFGSTINFDFTSNVYRTVLDAIRIRDWEKPTSKKRYDHYAIPDISGLNKSSLEHIYKTGLVTHITYSTLAHFESIKSKLLNAGEISFFSDPDSIINLSVLTLFKDEIKSGLVNYVQVMNPDILDQEKIENLGGSAEKNPHGNHTKSISSMNTSSIEAASLNGVDNYFQQIRRRLNMMERSITTASGSSKWNGYASYNPKYISMLVEIWRIYSNYVLNNKKHLRKRGASTTPTTPAQRLGLVDEKFSIYDIIEFSEIKHMLYERPMKSMAE